jgi:hypothetical protein
MHNDGSARTGIEPPAFPDADPIDGLAETAEVRQIDLALVGRSELFDPEYKGQTVKFPDMNDPDPNPVTQDNFRRRVVREHILAKNLLQFNRTRW